MNRVYPEGLCNRQENRCQDHHGRRCVHKTAYDQKNDDDKQNNYRFTVRHSHNSLCKHIGNLFDRQYFGKSSCTAHNNQDRTRSKTRIRNNFKQLFKIQLPVNKHSAQQRINTCYGCSLCRCENAFINTAQNNNRINQCPFCLPERI